MPKTVTIATKRLAAMGEDTVSMLTAINVSGIELRPLLKRPKQELHQYSLAVQSTLSPRLVAKLIE